MNSIDNGSMEHDAHQIKKSDPASSEKVTLVTAEVERRGGVTLEELTDLFILESVKQFGPQKFKGLHKENIRPGNLPPWELTS